MALIWHLSSSGSGQSVPLPSYTPAHRALLAAYAGRYPIEPRLSGALPSAESTREAAGSSPLLFEGSLTPDILIASAHIDADLTREETPSTIAAKAISNLLAGRSQLALGQLEAVRLHSSKDVRVLNDLAAAYIVSGVESGKATDLLDALAYADEASELAPGQPEPLFNLALALQLVNLRDRARESWEAYLRLDSTSPWSEVARTHLDHLDAPTPLERWEHLRQQIEAWSSDGSGDGREHLPRLLESPQQALEYAEGEALKRWATATSSGAETEANRNLKILKLVAAAIPPESGGMPLRRATELISTAEGLRPVRVAEAHVLLFHGISAYEEGDLVTAREALARASERLASVGSPYSGRARFYLALCLYQERSFDEAATVLSSLIETAGTSGDLLVRGWALHVLGLLQGIGGKPTDALQHYESALEVYRDAGWTGRAVAMEGLLAEMEEFLGDPEAAWAHRLRALAGLTWIGDPKTQVRFWSEATTTALRRSDVLAGLFAEELADVAQRVEDPRLRAISSRLLGSVLYAQGKVEEALSQFDEAVRWVEQIENASIAESIRGDLLFRRAEVLTENRPREALMDLQGVQDIFLKQDNRVALPRVLRARAHCLVALGDSDQAEHELESAIASSEEIAGSVDDPFAYSTFVRVGRPVYDEAIGLKIDQGLPGEALSLADRFRAVTVLPWSSSPGGMQLPYLFPPVRLPRSTPLLFFHSLKNRLAVWTLQGDESRLTVVPGPRADLVRDVQSVRRALMAGSREGAPLEILSRTLLPEALPVAGETQTLIVVPDSVLYGIPFQALWNPGTGRRLMDDFDVVVSPSISLALGYLGESGATTFDRSTAVLAMGDPVAVPELEPGLQPLPEARTEVQLISELFPRSDVYVGSDATESRLLEGLGHYDILHFAGHGRSNPETPLLSMLFLAPDEAHDGIVFVKDVMALRPTGTKMIVLSSCGLGPDANMGLTQAMIGSGIPIVVETLWDVNDDLATAFSSEFYRQLADGTNVVSAFTAAQREIRTSADRRWGSPNAWAAFRITVGSPAGYDEQFQSGGGE